MSDELEKKIEELKSLIEKPKSPPIGKYAGVILTVVVLSAGIIATWTTVKAEVADLRGDLTKIERVIEKQDESILDVKIKVVQESSDLKSVKEDVAEIKADVKKLLEAR